MDAKTKGLRSVLERNRLQQLDVAAALGVSRVAVWFWVSGRTAPTKENLQRLLEYLQRFEPTLTVADIVGRTDASGAVA